MVGINVIAARVYLKKIRLKGTSVFSEITGRTRFREKILTDDETRALRCHLETKFRGLQRIKHKTCSYVSLIPKRSSITNLLIQTKESTKYTISKFWNLAGRAFVEQSKYFVGQLDSSSG